MSMRSVVLAALLATAPAPSLAQDDKPRLGRPATPAEIESWDITVAPDGAGLPHGSGTARQGEAVYVAKCLACHGEKGKGGPALALVGGKGTIG